MSFTAGLAIDAASGLVLLGFGVLFLRLRAPTAATRAYAWFCLVFGMRAAANNLMAIADVRFNAILVWSNVAAYVVPAGFLAWFALSYKAMSAPVPRRDLVVASGTLGVGVVLAAAWSPSELGPYWLTHLLVWASSAASMLLAARFRHATEGDRPSLAFAGAALSLWAVAVSGGHLAALAANGPRGQGPEAILEFAHVILAIVGPWTAWVFAGLQTHDWSAWWTSAAMPGWALVNFIASAFLGPGDTGFAGITRTVALLLVVAAFAHDGLLRGSLAVRRGAWAASLLGVLLVVAQIAQNFFAARFGLILGGIVAGILLFAASPIQRALEGRAAARRIDDDDGARRSFREAARYALRDAKLTRREETHLAELAQRLGLGAADALRIRHEVEDELGPRNVRPVR